MKKHWLKVSAYIAIMMLALTGCGSSMPQLTQEEEQMVGEYAAKILLKYDANNRSRLVSREEVAIEEEKQKQREAAKQEILGTSSDAQQGMEPVEDTPVVEVGQETGGGSYGSPETFFELPEGMVITYNGNLVSESYPQDQDADSYFALDAAEGKKLLVLQFNVANQSGADQDIDFLSHNAVIRLQINGGKSQTVLTTMLMDDLSTYIGNVSAGGSVDLVLLAEVDSSMVDNISSLSLSLKNDSKSCTIQLQ